MDKELVLVIDFGGQYNQLVARRVRENNVYCVLVFVKKCRISEYAVIFFEFLSYICL